MALPIDSKMSAINPRIKTASEIAAEQKIDKKALENLEKAMQKLGVDILQKLQPAYMEYLRMTAESLSALASRFHEIDFKSLQAQPGHLPTEKFFLSRDTSKGVVYQDKLPENFLTVETLDKAVKTGLLTKAQVDAIKVFFGLSAEAAYGQRQERQVMQAFQAQGGQQNREQGGNSGQQSGQDQPYEEEEVLEQIGSEGSSGPTTGTYAYSYQVSQGTPQTGGTFAGGALRGGMRQNVSGPGGSAPGGPGGAPGGFPPPPPPPPPPHQGGNAGPQGTTPYEQYMQGLPAAMQQEQGFLDGQFSPGDPFYSLFQNLFGSENWYRDFAAKALTGLQSVRDAKQRIMAELAGIDPSSPEGAKRLYILQQKLSEMQMSERQYLDFISSAQKANNERKEHLKSILDAIFQTSGAIIRNIRN